MKIGVVGLGNLGRSVVHEIAWRLVAARRTDVEVGLYSRNPDRSAAFAAELTDWATLRGERLSVSSGDYGAMQAGRTKPAAMVVCVRTPLTLRGQVCKGFNDVRRIVETEGMDWPCVESEQVEQGFETMRDLFAANLAGFTGWLIVCTNPVDVWGHLAARSGIAPSRIVTHHDVDRIRLQTVLSVLFGKPPSDIKAVVAGEHGLAVVPLLSASQIRLGDSWLGLSHYRRMGQPIPLPEAIDVMREAEFYRDICRAVSVERSLPILEHFPGTTLAPAASAVEIVFNLLGLDGPSDTSYCLGRQVLLTDRPVFTGVPCVIGPNSVQVVHDLLGEGPEEQELLTQSVHRSQSGQSLIDSLVALEDPGVTGKI